MAGLGGGVSPGELASSGLTPSDSLAAVLDHLVVDTCPSEVFASLAILGYLILLRDVMIGAPYRDAGYSQGDGCLILLRDVTTGAPPLGLFVVLRSRRVTFCFLLLAGCFVFMGTLCFCFCGYDLRRGIGPERAG